MRDCGLLVFAAVVPVLRLRVFFAVAVFAAGDFEDAVFEVEVFVAATLLLDALVVVAFTAAVLVLLSFTVLVASVDVFDAVSEAVF